MNANLQQAIDALSLRDIYQRNSVSICTDGFEPKYSDPEKLTVQHMHQVRKSEMIFFEEEKLNVLRVFLSLGARWVETDQAQEPENNIMARIESEFVSEYLVNEELSQEAIDEYCLKNSSYHVWPFWREFLMSQCTRMQLPKFVLPTMQLAHNRHQE